MDTLLNCWLFMVSDGLDHGTKIFNIFEGFKVMQIVAQLHVTISIDGHFPARIYLDWTLHCSKMHTG